MVYTPEVQGLVDDPLGGRSVEEVRVLFDSELVREAMKWPAPQFMIQRFIGANDYTEQAALDLFDEVKKFLIANRVLNVKTAPSEPVDIMWHAWILFTRDYMAFCDSIGGYIHHIPYPKDSPQQPPLEPTIEIMRAAWGDAAAEKWPIELGAFGGRDCKAGP